MSHSWTIGPVARGCRFVVLKWKPNAKRRGVMSCHRKVTTARNRQAELREGDRIVDRFRRKNPGVIPKVTFKFGVYDVKTKKMVK